MKNNPYIGPRPFERADRDKFFGRLRETRDLLSLIMAERVVLFYAQSGAGKTSLLSTQIIPALEEQGFNVLPIVRVGGDMPLGVDATAAKNVFVFSALLSLAGEAAQPQDLLQQTLSGFLQQSTDDEFPPIVIIDQFEEILTTHRERWQEVRGFVEQLRDALTALPKLGVVLAMREDYVAGLEPYAVLLPRRLKARFRMELLGYDGALEAVRKPAQNAGFGYGTGVAEHLVDDLRRIQRAADNSLPDKVYGPYVEPVQLQVVCSQLWNNMPERDEHTITWPDIEQFGNIDRALTNFYESALAQTLAAHGSLVSERQLRRWFGKQLITPMQTRGLVMRGANDTGDLPNSVVDLLEAQHLIRSDVRAGAHWYELAHDRLVDPIVASNAAWEQARMTPLRATAQNWQQSKNADLLYGGLALLEAQQWARTHPSDVEDYEREFLEASVQAQRTKARNRVARLSLIAILSAGLVVMAVLAVLAFQSKQEADQQRVIAYDAQATAVAGQQAAEQQRQIAVTAEAQAETQQRLAQVRQLASQAQQSLDKSPQRSVLLALEAMNVSSQAPQSSGQIAEQALRDTLSTVGGRGVTTLNNDARAVAFSPDGRWLAIGGDDVQIFDRENLSAIPISLTGNTAAITALAFNPAGQLAVSSLDGTVRIWNSSDWPAPPTVLGTSQVAAANLGHLVGTVAFSPDGRQLAAGMADGRVRLWGMHNLSAPPQVLAAGEGANARAVRSLAFSPKAPLLAVGSDDRAIRVWDLNNPGTPLQSIEASSEEPNVFSLAFSSDGQQLAAALNQNVLVWNVADGLRRPITLTIPGQTFTAVAFSPRDQSLLAGDLDGNIYAWDRVEPGPESKPPRLLAGHENAIYDLALSSDGQWLASASRDKSVRLWNLTRASDTATPYALFPSSGFQALNDGGHWLIEEGGDSTLRAVNLTAADPISSPTVLHNAPIGLSNIELSGDQHWLGALGRDGVLTLWDFTQPSAAPTAFQTPSGTVTRFHLTADGRWLVAQGADQVIYLWNLSNQSRTPIALPAVESWAVSPDGHWLGTYSADQQFRLWDFTTADPQAKPITLENASETYSLNPDRLSNLGFSSNGRWLLAQVNEPRPKDVPAIWLWDLRQPSATIKPLALNPDAAASTYTFSPDGRWLAAVTKDAQAFIWDLQANDPASNPIIVGNGQALSVAFSPDGRWLAMGGNDKTTYLWDTTHLTGTPRSLLGQNSAVNRVVFSPDSKWLATSGMLGGSGGLYVLPEHYEDPAVLLWDLEQPTPAPLTIHSPARSLTAEGFSPDVRWLITDNDSGMQLWQVKVDELISKACEAAGRNLTPAEWQQYFPNQDYDKTCAQWP